MVQSLRGRPVSELMTAPLIVSPLSTVSKLIGSLRDAEAYEAFLVEGERIGTVSMRDVLKTANIASRKLSTIAVYLPKLSPAVTVGEAAAIMAEHRVRSLPVVERGELVGQVTSLSILDLLLKSQALGLRATNVMTPHPITLDGDDTAAKARDLMVRRRIDHLPVLSSGRLGGILTSSDLVFRVIPPEGLEKEARVPEAQRRFTFPVREIMDTTPLTCDPNDEILKVLDAMIGRRRTCSLVKLWEELQGIITYRDFMKLIAEPREESEVPAFIVGLPDDPFEAEAARAKFVRAVNALRRSFPSILEARSVIKVVSRKPGKERRRYEVSVTVRTPKDTYVYSELGWELPAIYDVLTDRMKRLMTQKPGRRKPGKRRSAEMT